MFARAAAAGLMSVGVDVMDLGVVPTPTVQLAVEHHHAGAGLILTASHNPIEWNALKFVGPDGIFLDAAAGERVRALAEQGPRASGVGRDRASCGRTRRPCRRHLDAVLGLPVIDVAAIRGRRFQVALDCVRGAGAVAILPLLERLGCRVSGINLEPDGRFPRAPEPVPENLGELGQLVRESGADSGSRWTPTWTAWRWWTRTAGRSARTTRWRSRSARCWTDAANPLRRPTVVVNLSTSLVVEDAARAVGATLVRAPVGEANVARAMRERGRGDRRRGQRRGDATRRCTSDAMRRWGWP